MDPLSNPAVVHLTVLLVHDTTWDQKIGYTILFQTEHTLFQAMYYNQMGISPTTKCTNSC